LKKNTNILIVGYGSIGKRHYNNLKTIGYKNISIVRSGKGIIKDEINDEDKIYYDLDEALKFDPEIVFITNPTSYHIDSALKAAKAGCHIFIEKPVSNSINKCDKLLAVIEEKKLITMVGFQFRFHPFLIRLKEMLKNKEITNIYRVEACYSEYLPNWHPWEEYKLSYASRKELGGGVILTLTHSLDYLYWIFGEISKIQATYNKLELLDTNVEDDIASLNLKFASGLLGHVHLDFFGRPPKHFLSIFSDNFNINIDFIKNIMTQEFNDGRTKELNLEKSFERNDMYLNEILHFFECISNRTQTMIPLSSGIEILKYSLSAKNYV
jgi:predicted dehydrogenase